jgi:hypothetical protein
MASSSRTASQDERSLYQAFRRLNPRGRRDVALRILKDEKLLADLYDHLLIKRAVDEPGASIPWPSNGSDRYDVLLRPAAARDLASLEPKLKARIEKALDRLRENPRPPGAK